ncbi:MAG: hypothetical protein ACKPKO_41030, partial [Candidatus Fonsibacter sp.]
MRTEVDEQLTQPDLAAEFAGGSDRIEQFTAPPMSIHRPIQHLSQVQHVQNNQLNVQNGVDIHDLKVIFQQQSVQMATVVEA